MHLQRLYVNTGSVDELLEAEPLPACVSALWDAFVDLSRTRPAGLGPSPLTFAEVHAWCSLHGARFNPWELDVLMSMDAAVLHEAAKGAKR